ncbi:hypothetical protein ACPCKL_02430 [Streptomyces cellulosae]
MDPAGEPGEGDASAAPQLPQFLPGVDTGQVHFAVGRPGGSVQWCIDHALPRAGRAAGWLRGPAKQPIG